MSFTANIDELVAQNRNRLLGAHPSWKRIKLKEIAKILNGYPFESTRFSKDAGTPLIRIRDILDGQTETFYKGEIDPTFLVQPGEILVGMDGDFHCSPWVGDPALLNQRVCKITPDESRYSKHFLRYVLPGYLSAINAETPSVTVKHLSSRTIADIPLPLPPLADQRRIVAEIEKQFTRLDAGVAALRRVQANLKRYRAAVLKAACEGRLVPTESELAKRPSSKRDSISKKSVAPDFESGAKLLEHILNARRKNWPGNGKYKEPIVINAKTLPSLPDDWAWASMRQVGEVQLGRQRAPQHHTGDNMRPYLRVANVFEARIETSDVKEMNFTPVEFERYQLKFGDILLNEGQTPELVGRPAMFRDEVAECCYQKTLLRFRAYEGVLPHFALIIFRSYMHNRRFTRAASITTNIAHLTAEKFVEIEFPLPPLAEQKRIVAEVERRLSVIDELETLATANLARATCLRQSILQQAFTGELA